MALVIRFRKQGKRNRQCFRLVVADRRTRRDGKYLEQLGWYDPFGKEKTSSVNGERVKHWIGLGAEISDRARAVVKAQAPEALK